MLKEANEGLSTEMSLNPPSVGFAVIKFASKPLEAKANPSIKPSWYARL